MYIYTYDVLTDFVKLTGKHLCQSLFFNKVADQKEALAQVFSCEFCTISENIFSYRTHLGDWFSHSYSLLMQVHFILVNFHFNIK